VFTIFVLMKTILFALRYLKYLFLAKNERGIHSPFISDLFTNIIKDKNPYYIYKEIAVLRNQLLNSKKKIIVIDYGTGTKQEERAVSNITKKSAKSEKYGQLLFRITNHFKPSTALELGTSLGISTMYQAFPIKTSRFTTLEGSPEIAKIAQENFKELNINNVKSVVGSFESTLTEELEALGKLDYCFF